MYRSPLAHLIFALSLPVGALALLAGLFLLFQFRRQTPAQRAVWASAWLAGMVLWLCGVVTTLAGAQHHRSATGQAALLLGNTFVVLGGLSVFLALFRSLRSRRL